MSCKVVGISKSRIKMNDDNIRTLKNIRHMKDLKKNLIFFGTLDSHCYIYLAGG